MQKADFARNELNVGDHADDRTGQRPKNDHNHNQRLHTEFTDNLRPPWHGERSPNDLIWFDTDVAIRHMKRSVMDECLTGDLGVPLRVKFDEH